MKLLGLLVAAVPFAFAGIRWFTTGTDTRYLWMALASTLCAALIVRFARIRRSVRAAVAVAAASAGAAAIAIAFLGATAGLGIAIVAGSFGLCSGLGVSGYMAPSGSV